MSDRSLEPAAMAASDRTKTALNEDLTGTEFKRLMELMHLSGKAPSL